MRSILLSFLLLSINFFSTAQIQTARFEAETSWNHREFLAIPSGNQGLVLLHEQKADRDTGENRIKLHLLDNNLVQIGEELLSLPPEFVLRNHASNGAKLYLVFTRELLKPNDSYLIVDIDLIKNSVKWNRVNSAVPFELLHAEVVNDKLKLSGNTEGVPLLLEYEPQQTVLRAIDINRSKGSIVSLRANDDNQSYNLISSERINGKFVMNFRTYFEKELIFEKEVAMGYEILDAKSVGFVNGNIVVIGTYGSKSKRFVQGLFFVMLSPKNTNDQVKYYDFSEFTNFFAYENDRKEARLNQKATDRAESGGALRQDKFLFIQDLTKMDDNIILSLDVYRKVPVAMYPRNRNDYEMMHSTSSDRLSNHLLNNAHDPQLFNYYRLMDHRDIDLVERETARELLLLQHWTVGFRENGDIAWDNSMPLLEKDRLTGYRIISSSTGKSAVNFLYYHDDKLVFSKVPYTSDRQEELIIPIELRDENEKIRKSSTLVGSWYKTAFYVWGYQRIKGKDGKRDVLFINKVEFPDSQTASLN